MDTPEVTRIEGESLPQGLTAPPTAIALLLALKRRWLLSTCLAVLGAVGFGAAAWLAWPSGKFTAQSLLHVESQQPHIAFQKGESRNDFQSYQRTQIALVKSRFVINAALRHPDVAALSIVRGQADPITWLQRELTVDFTTAPEILRVALNGDQPEAMKLLVAQVTKAYLEEIVKREDTQRRERLEKLKEVSERYQESLRAKRRTLRELAESVGSGDPNTLALKQRFAQEQLASEEKELLQLESDLRKLNAELTLQSSKEKHVEGWSPAATDLEELARRDTVIAKLMARKTQLEQDVEETVRLAVRGEEEPVVKSMRKEIAAAEESIKARQEVIRPTLTAQYRTLAQQQIKGNIESTKDRIRAMEELRNTLAQDVNRLRSEGRSLNKGSLDIESYKQEIAQAEETARKVSAEHETLSVELRAVPRVHELESAFVSQADDHKKRLAVTSMAILMGIVGGAGLVAWREHRAKRIQSVNEVVQGLGINLLGTVAPLPTNTQAELVLTAVGPDLDALDAARAMVLHAARVRSTKVIMITSAVAGEGKTSLAVRLAASIARTGRKTLLIDSDLRRPTLHERFALRDEVGLSEALLNEIPVDKVVHPSGLEGLSIIPAGQSTSQALQALTQDNFRLVIGNLRKDFDFVIVDSSPVLPVADTLLVAQQVEAVILSVLHDKSQMDTVHEAHQLLTQMGVLVLGAVVNGIQETRRSRYNYSETAPEREKIDQLEPFELASEEE